MSVQEYILILLLFQKVSGDCLENFRITENQNNSLTLAWDYTCDQCSQCISDQVNGTSFKVYWEHKKWLACDENNKYDGEGGPGKDHMEIKNENQITIDNLHPYSKYKISIKPLPIYKIKIRRRPEQPEDLFADTLQGLPDVAPSKSDLPFRIGSDNIQFSWNSPDKSECENFNAQLDGYIYELKGNSPWNKNRTFLQKDVRKPTNSLSVFFSSLMPFSKYNLTVYTKSAEGLYNSNMPLNLSAETKPDEKAGTPRDLKVIETVDGSKHQTSWLPPYPPTGEVDRYDIQYKEAKSEVWSYYDRIEKPFKTCSKQEDSQTQDEYETRICFTLNVTDSNIGMIKNITYSMVAYNLGSSVPSESSKSVFPMPEEVENSGMTILFIIIGIVALVLLILFAFCIMRKYNSHQL